MELVLQVFNKLFFFLQPSPYLPEMTDPEKVQSEYRYWRIRTFYSIYLGYALFYFTRKSFTFAMPAMITELGMSKADLGFLGTILYVSYGLSKFGSGILSDKANPRYVMGIGLILTGLCNLFFGMSSSLLFFAIFWGLNGVFQGWGWPSCTKLLMHWYSRSERGRWWSLHSTSHNLGGALIPLIAAFAATHWGWRAALWVPAVICMVAGLWLIRQLRDVPQTMGLPCVEKFRGEPITEASIAEAAAPELSVRQILFTHILNNPYVWVLSLSYFFVYIVRTAVNDWGVLYLVQAKGYSNIAAAGAVSWFEVGGFLGTLSIGWASDAIFRGHRVPAMLACAAGLLVICGVYWQYPGQALWIDSLWMAAVGFLIFGPQLLVGIAAAEYVDKKASCTANGFAGCFAYIGAASTGYPLGKIIDVWGWEGFFLTLMICTAAVFVVLLPLARSHRPKAALHEASAAAS